MDRWVGLVGRAGAGKDFTASAMMLYSRPMTRVSFADGVRHEIEEVLGVSIPALWRKPYSDEVRRLQQWWGTDLRRAQDSEWWVRRGIEAGRRVRDNGRIPVFTDVRFINEAVAIQEEGGFLVRVTASDAVRAERLGGSLPPEHRSESEVDLIECDYVLVSDPDENPEYNHEVKRLVDAAMGMHLGG